MSTESLPSAAPNFLSAQLLVQDFDGTVARTFEKSPSGIGVHEAHEIVVEDMFGLRGLEKYRADGGLRNRAPLEVVTDLTGPIDQKEQEHLVGEFVTRKLNVLTGEIGTTFPDGKVWPRPTHGYVELLESIYAARIEGKIIDEAVLSSGHEKFIRETYRAWCLDAPDFFVTEETTRPMAQTLPAELLVKPSAMLMDIIRSLWRHSYDVTISPAPRENDRIVYVGDDSDKDGRLARNSGVEFYLVNPDDSMSTWRQVAHHLSIGYTVLNEMGLHV